jgi:hypothetical protein
MLSYIMVWDEAISLLCRWGLTAARSVSSELHITMYSVVMAALSIQ